MPFLTFDPSAGMYDATPIENMFLAEYLPTAPDSFLRVYLYMRMLLLHPEMGMSASEICRVLRITEETLTDAMLYWERQGLVLRTQDNPPAYAFLPVSRAAVSPMESDYYANRDFNASLQALFGGGNLLHPKEYEMAYDWLNVFHMSQDAVLKLVELQLKKSRSPKPDLGRLFKKVHERVVELADKDIHTLEELNGVLSADDRLDKAAKAILKRLSMNRAATQDEMALIRKWLDEWQIPLDEILRACQETVRSRNPSLAYLDAVLSGRRSGEDDARFQALKAVLNALGDPVTPGEPLQKSYQALLDKGFAPGTILLAADQCSRKRRHRFEDLEWMLGQWAREGVFTEADAKAYLSQMNDARAQVQRLLTLSGSDRRPTMADIRLVERWREQWPQPVLDYAAECARGMQVPMKYMEKLLEGWQQSGVRSVEEAQAQRAQRAPTPAGAAPQANPALNYQQRSADEISLDGLFLNLDEYGGEDK